MALCILAAAVGAAAVGACGAGTAAHTPTVGRDTAAARSGAYYAFLTQTGSALVDSRTIAAAQTVLIQRCLRGSGFRYLPDDPPAATVATGDAPDVVTNQQLDETAAVRRAVTRGYGLYASYVAARKGPNQFANASPQAVYVHSLGPARDAVYEQLLAGPASSTAGTTLPDGSTFTYSGGGCEARADAGLYGSREVAVAAIYVPEDFALDISEQVERDPLYVHVLAQWSACMRSATNRRFAAPGAVAKALEPAYSEDGPTPRLQSEERTLAVDDVRCQFATRVLQTRKALFAVHAVQLPRGYVSLLSMLLSAQVRATGRAARILATAG